MQVAFHFHGELNDFLRPEQRRRDIVCALPERAAVKHPIESLGVPHPEVGCIAVNGCSVDFTYAVREGDVVHVFPYGVRPQINHAVALRPSLSPPVRFALDTHLGQLAIYLRMLGFDTIYRNDFTDQELAQLAADEERLLLTRDRGLLKRKIVVFGHCVRAIDPRGQLVSVLRRYDLAAHVQPWQRCVRCNGLLELVDKAAILDRLEPKTRLYYDTFRRCVACGQIYWQGSHFSRMERFVEGVLSEVSEAT